MFTAHTACQLENGRRKGRGIKRLIYTQVRPLTVMGYDDAPSGHPEVRSASSKDECGSYEIVKARFWPWLSGESSQNISTCSLIFSCINLRVDFGRLMFHLGRSNSSKLIFQLRLGLVLLLHLESIFLLCETNLSTFGGEWI